MYRKISCVLLACTLLMGLLPLIASAEGSFSQAETPFTTLHMYSRHNPEQFLIRPCGEVTPHFQVWQVMCGPGNPNSRCNRHTCPPNFVLDTRLVEVLHNMVERHGPLHIVGPLRCPEHARQVNPRSAETTLHRIAIGRALDVYSTSNPRVSGRTLFHTAIAYGAAPPRGSYTTPQDYTYVNGIVVHVAVNDIGSVLPPPTPPTPPAPPLPGTPFTDVDENAPYANAIRWVYQQHFMNGTSHTTFEPHISLDRSMLATLLHRYVGEPNVAFRPVFSDVLPGQWYTNGIVWANKHQIVNGVGDGRFAPAQTLTKQELAVMFHHFAREMGQNVSVPSHVQAPAGTAPWATEAMRWAVHHNLFLGEGTPTANATRADTAVFLYRFAN